MLKYLTRRLLLAIPVLLIISFFVFVIGNLVPGNQADIQFEGEDLLLMQRQNVDEQERSLRALRERFNLDLPIFYLSVSSLAEPDTLHRVYPESDRQLLGQMALKHGNWGKIAAYHETLVILRRTWVEQNMQQPSTNLYPFIAPLFEQTDIRQLQATIDKLRQQLKPNNQPAEMPDLLAITNILDNRLKAMRDTRRPLMKYIPTLVWNGTSNRYHQWLAGVFRGDLGKSHIDNKPVAGKIGNALQVTLSLSLIAVAMIFAFGIPMGLFIAEKTNDLRARMLSSMMVGLDAVPLFYLSILSITFLAGTVFLKVFPTYGLGDVSISGMAWYDRFSVRLYHLVLPIGCMVLSGMPYVVKQVETSFKEVLNQTYIIALKAKGLHENVIKWKHAFSKVLFTVISLFTGFIPAAVSGALVVEVVFSIPGMGKLIADAVFSRDYPVIMAVVLLIAIVRIAANILGDVAYFRADPRVRFQ